MKAQPRAAVVLLAKRAQSWLLRPGFGRMETRHSTRRTFSPAPYLDDLAKVFGNESDAYVKAASIQQRSSEDATNEIAQQKSKVLQEMDKVLQLMDEVLQLMDKVAELNMTAVMTTLDLFDATTESLRLRGMLDVRGMIEDIERMISPGKMRFSNVNSSSLWSAALSRRENEALAASLAACCPNHGDATKEAVIKTIKSVYNKSCTRPLSHVDSLGRAIVVRHRDYPGTDELGVIRVLASHFKFKIVEEDEWGYRGRTSCG